MTWSVGTKLSLGFGVAPALLVFLGIMAYRSITTLIQAADQVAHTYQAQQYISASRFLMAEAQVGHRGYIITGVEISWNPTMRRARRSPHISRNCGP